MLNVEHVGMSERERERERERENKETHLKMHIFVVREKNTLKLECEKGIDIGSTLASQSFDLY